MAFNFWQDRNEQNKYVRHNEFANLVLANQNFVISGCAVSLSSGMTVALASGSIYINGTGEIAVSGQTVVIDAGHATLNRVDLLVINTSGVLSAIKGTAATVPTTPSYTETDYVCVGHVYIPTGAASLLSANIINSGILNSLYSIAATATSLKSPVTSGLAQLTGMGAGTTRVYTVPNANATLLTSAAAVTVAQGGTGKSSVTSNSYLKGNGTGALVERTYAEVKTDLGLDNVTNVAQLPIGGGTLTGRLILHNAFTSNLAPLNIPEVGTSDPSSLSDGDIWHRSDLLYARLNGTTRVLYHAGNASTAALTTVSQEDAEAGTSTTVRAWTAQRVRQAIDIVPKNTVPYTLKTSTYTATTDDGLILCNGTFTVNTPATLKVGQVLTIKNWGTGVITINPDASDKIDGSTANRTLDSQYSFIQILRVDEDDWIIIGGGTYLS